MRTVDLASFIFERDAIRIKRAKRLPKPWTEDPILQRYRFCNIRREDDAVTQWIAKNWRIPCENDPHVWFLMAVARLVNWPDTMEELTAGLQDTRDSWSVRWNAKKFIAAMHARRARGEKVFGGAYIVSTNGRAMDKAEYLAEYVLSPLWQKRDLFYSMKLGYKSSLTDLYEEFLPFNGMGTFMAAQVVADVKYTPPYRDVRDWYDFAAPGPGSKRGLNRVCDRLTDEPWPRNSWLITMYTLSAEMATIFKQRKMERLHNQDLQNCLCEFDKYERVRLGEGTPRARYPGV